MPIQPPSVLKGYFNDGDVPSELAYIDLIDSMYQSSQVWLGPGSWAQLEGGTKTYTGGTETAYDVTNYSIPTGVSRVYARLLATAPTTTGHYLGMCAYGLYDFTVVIRNPNFVSGQDERIGWVYVYQDEFAVVANGTWTNAWLFLHGYAF